jgi:hypothetical protein
MDECTATSTITLHGEDIVVICNLGEHRGNTHWDVVHGDWTAAVGRQE